MRKNRALATVCFGLLASPSAWAEAPVAVTTPEQAIHIAMDACAADFRKYHDDQFADAAYWAAQQTGDHWDVAYLRALDARGRSNILARVKVGVDDGTPGACFVSLTVSMLQDLAHHGRQRRA